MALVFDQSNTIGLLTSKKDLFSLPHDIHYLNCAYMAPLSKRVVAAGRSALERLENPSRIQATDFFEESDAARGLFAELINAPDPRNVAIIPSVSYAMATVAKNTSFCRGQNLVVVEEQFPSNIYSWRRLSADAGIELRIVKAPLDTGSRGAQWNTSVLEAIDTETALVTLPQLHWTDGTRFDLEAIGQRARDCGAAFIVDGTQSVGALPFDSQNIRPDVLVCAGYKWLTGPYSVGLAFFGPAYNDGIPLEENWITRRGSEDFTNLVRYQDEYHVGAIRYDVGERSNFMLLPMLTAGLEQVLNWGPATIQDYTGKLTAEAIAPLREVGCWVEEDGWRASHILGVRMPSHINIEHLSNALLERHVSVSIRGSAIRVAPHLYNESGDLAALVAVVQDIIRQ